MTLIEKFQAFGLSYHYDHLTTAISHCGPLTGKRVFEIGGCLPREIVCDELGASMWLGIDHSDYWEISGDDNPSNRIGVPRAPLDGFYFGDAEHICLDGDILNLPASFMQAFDFVFSTSALEHVADLKGTLQIAANLLKRGGSFFAVAMPIWPSSRGHHLPPITCDNESFSFLNPPFPDWAHLTMDAEEMIEELSRWLPHETARQIAYMCYESPHINRAFVEDYEEAFLLAPFSERNLIRVPDRPIAGDIREKIISRHGEHRLDQYGICLSAVR
ncbi:MAG: methyltransferase domain-containing protein [Alphaproteobacteria bacterium]|nr:methyltransferase domain-containing protein [Alphaproteobacteria bacterium]